MNRLEQDVSRFLAKLKDDNFLGSLSPSIYEGLYLLTSPLASRVKFPNKLEFLNSLSNKKMSDGTWSESPGLDYLPDKIVNSLIVLLALKNTDLLQNSDVILFKQYLNSQFKNIFELHESKKTIGFEGIFLNLVKRLKSQNIEIIEPTILSKLDTVYKSKINKKITNIYNARNTLLSVLDIFETANLIEWNRLSTLQESGGSMGIYPSSTIALLNNIGSDTEHYFKGMNYLQDTIQYYKYLPAFYPSELFERVWSLYNIVESPLCNKSNKLDKYFPSNIQLPVAVSKEFSLPDVDTSAMLAILMLNSNKDYKLDFLNDFYKEGRFLCYVNENRTSPSANIHALMCIVKQAKLNNGEVEPEFSDIFQKTFDYIISSISDEGYIEDKWHVSDLYTTSHCMELFIDILDLKISNKFIAQTQLLLRKMCGYILTKRKLDGGFTCFSKSTIEETGYAVRAISKYKERNSLEVPQNVFNGSRKFIEDNWDMTDPPMWIGKTLYRSNAITESVKLSAYAYLL